MKRSRQLRDLVRINDALFTVRQSEMAALKAREMAVRTTLAALDADRDARDAALAEEIDAARLAGADPRWQQWIAGRKRLLTGELARLLAQQDRARRDLAQAFGRTEATRGLLDRHDQSRLKRLERLKEAGR